METNRMVRSPWLATGNLGAFSLVFVSDLARQNGYVRFTETL
jgi:hypothetical protein